MIRKDWYAHTKKGRLRPFLLFFVEWLLLYVFVLMIMLIIIFNCPSKSSDKRDLMLAKKTPPLGVVLVNLGTPDAPTAPAVRRFLKQFLSDTRVIEIPPILWQIILNLFILPFRPKRVAKLYASIWQGDSPMRAILHATSQFIAAAAKWFFAYRN
jgi:hypothetical protein